ncbi:hypothetical protein Daus18300_001749 [Diaporthe australafricana]|uniref:Uncharacterized protein n=1 Tax=Diaporthe australafricana TaxID=127596 RepID=A0ABR3XU09_9PEZI
MGQAQSRFAGPARVWHRLKPKATSRQQSQDASSQSSCSSPDPSSSFAQTNDSSSHADQSSTAANTTTTSTTLQPDLPSGAMTENRDKIEEQASSPPDGPATDQPTGTTEEPTDATKEPTDATKELTVATKETTVATKEPADATKEPAANRPAIKREYTPPQHVRIETKRAWKSERMYGNLHEHVKVTLNKVRQQQMDSELTDAASARLENDIYNAADRCTLAEEQLVGNFSSRFFEHAGPHKIRQMMTTIEADACAVDELRHKQLKLFNYGYTLEKRLDQMRDHILELADVAKRIRDEDHPVVEEDGEADAEGDTDPEVKGSKDGDGMALS